MRSKQSGIFESLQEGILKGVYKNGTLLPSEEALAKQYSVSRPTIAKVYNQLQDNGYIKKTRGYGSQVIYNNAKSTYTIGLLLPSSGESEIFIVINDQLLKSSRKSEINYLWEGATASNAEIRKSQIEQDCENYLSQKVDAILFSPLERLPDADEINLRIFNKIIGARIPLVLIDRGLKNQPEADGYDIIWLDNFLAGGVMAQHLIGKGCEMIHFFYRPNSANSVDLRLSGVRDKVLSNHLKFTDENIFCGDPLDIDFIKTMKIETGKTGIICANDSTAAELLSSLEKINIKPTSDCLICGCDDMKYSQYLKYPLTTYLQPCEEMASISLELAMRRIKKNNHIPTTVSLAGKLIERESTKFSH
ncbi:MAG: LacI family DNA-binding transcriptional regulator [Puia sp.]|nr:LacI family DNA-binding transcriptional regulator [Puia sp.]